MKENAPSAESGLSFQKFAQEMAEMVRVDQDMREKSLTEDVWDESVDAKNTARMKEIIAEIGWPTISKVGESASEHAWLLVQHADHDVAFQEQCLTLMKSEPDGEVALRNIAMLEDRARVNQGRPQVYGTQFRQDTGEHKPLPIEDEEHVDERRKLMGMETLGENIAEMYQKYGAPDQG